MHRFTPTCNNIDIIKCGLVQFGGTHMNDRERIIDLIKRGVISSAEGLTLLEDIAKQGGVTGRSGRTIVVDWHGDDATTMTTAARVRQHNEQAVLRAEETRTPNKGAAGTPSSSDERDEEQATVGKRPLRYLFRRSMRDVIDNVDWHDVARRLPGGQNRRGTKTFDFADCTASVLAFEVANGSVHYRTWDEPGLHITADVRVYGRNDGDPAQILADRSVIHADGDSLSFRVPDKRITVDLDVRLPRREYDHFDTQVLNGDVAFDEISGQDFYVKLANGNLRVRSLKASMFEVENVNGDISVRDLAAQDAVMSTVNGDLTVIGTVNALRFQTVNGVARADMNAPVESITGASVNGNVGVSLPRNAALTGHVQTQFGRLVFQAHDVPNPENARQVDLNRSGEKSGNLSLSTGAGDILIFDN